MPASSVPFSDAVRRFLTEPRFAVVGTLDADGWPHQAVVWFLLDGDRLVLNSEESRHWPANLRRDPRCSVVVFQGYDLVLVKGPAEPIDDLQRGQTDIAAMARRYHPPERAERLIEERYSKQRRVSFVVRPESVFVYGAIE